MSKSQRRYAAEFKAQMVALVRSGRSPDELAKEFPPSAKSIRDWTKQADLDDGRRADGLTTAERDELRRLRREVKNLRIEREILGKAAAWFARETESITVHHRTPRSPRRPLSSRTTRCTPSCRIRSRDRCPSPQVVPQARLRMCRPPRVPAPPRAPLLFSGPSVLLVASNK